jgi:DNA-binding transcriptional MerR regulator
MRTGKVADKTGVSPSYVRTVADSGALGPVPRDRAGQRRFDESHVERLKQIVFPATSGRRDNNDPEQG